MTEKLTVSQFINEVMANNPVIYGDTPRHSKSFMSEAITHMWNNFKVAYDEVYSMVFNEIKEDAGEEFSDDEIREFINKHIVFEVEVEEGCLHERPKIFITPKFKELEMDVEQ